MWLKAAFILELKRRAIYAYDFWLKMIIPPLIQLCVGYYLWGAIYSSNSYVELGGYTLEGMLLYTFIAASVYQMVNPEVGIVLRDLDTGALTKYLFYPVSFFRFKFMAHLAQMSLVFLQMIIGCMALFYLLGFSLPLTFQSIVLGSIATLLAGYLFFIIAASLELFGFWVETVWGLVVMNQFVTHLLGGKLIPLSLFPAWAKTTIYFLPFPYLVAFPTEIILGTVSSQEIIRGFCVATIWALIMTACSRLIWNKGSYQYSGTGM